MEDTQPKNQTILKDPLSIKIDDKKFADILKKRVDTAKKWFDKEKDLTKRVKKNKEYYFGKQIKVDQLKGYEGKWLDNVIWESGKSIKAMSLSKLPDLIVTPGSDNDQSITTAEELSKVIDTDIKKRERRRVLGQAFVHWPVYFRGVIKYRWDPEVGKNGDYVFEAVNPDKITVDNSSPTNDQKDMSFIDEELSLSLKELIMRFTDKKDEILQEARKDGINAEGKEEIPDHLLATEVHPHETWFDWYDETDGKVEKVSCVAWWYHSLLLKKIKNPNWDWKGQKRLFSYDEEIKEDQVKESLLTGMEIPGLTEEMQYNNYFESPEKPYIFLNGDLWGDSPIDETSWVEQLILMQYTLDERGKILVEKLRNRTKHVFSKDGGLKAEDIEEMDLNNPDEDLLVDGDVNKVHAAIPPDLPAAQEFKDYDDTRNRMFAKAGTYATRGEIQSDTATTNQIAREADFTRADDLVEETVNYAAEKMARAVLQMIKLRYTQEHYIKILGEEGKWIFQRVHSDMIEDGMEVMVTASGTDKIKAERRAMDMAASQLIDPLTFYKDIGASDPVGRTKKLLTFMMSPEQYLTEFVMGLKNPADMGNALNGGAGGGQQAMMDIAQMQQGVMPPVPQNVDAEYLDTLTSFMQSPDFMALPPELQQQIGAFAQEVLAMVDSQVGQPPSQQFGQKKGATNPMQPTPTNTSSVPTNQPATPQGSPRLL